MSKTLENLIKSIIFLKTNFLKENSALGIPIINNIQELINIYKFGRFITFYKKLNIKNIIIYLIFM